MIYTTYISKFLKLKKENKISESSINLLVMRYKPFWLNLEEFDMEQIKLLSPDEKLLKDFKNNLIDFQEFEEMFKLQMKGLDLLDDIERELKNGKDICFICCEKDYTECHRKILAEYFTNLNYKWEEL